MPAPQSGSPMTYSVDGPPVHRRRGQRGQLHGRVSGVRAPAERDTSNAGAVIALGVRLQPESRLIGRAFRVGQEAV